MPNLSQDVISYPYPKRSLVVKEIPSTPDSIVGTPVIKVIQLTDPHSCRPTPPRRSPNVTKSGVVATPHCHRTTIHPRLRWLYSNLIVSCSVSYLETNQILISYRKKQYEGEEEEEPPSPRSTGNASLASTRISGLGLILCKSLKLQPARVPKLDSKIRLHCQVIFFNFY